MSYIHAPTDRAQLIYNLLAQCNAPEAFCNPQLGPVGLHLFLDPLSLYLFDEFTISVPQIGGF